MERLLCSGREGELLLIEDREFAHLKALRIKRGDRIEVFCQGKLFLCSVVAVERSRALCQVVEELRIHLPKPLVTLYQCVPLELRLMEEVVDRASQTGVHLLVPVVCKRGFQKHEVLEEKTERWKRLSLASFKQCKRPQPMEIDRPVKLEELRPQEELLIVLDNFSPGLSVKELDKSKKSYGILVGPEGGLTAQEVKLLQSKGFLPVYLKPYILRTEMAGAVATALIMNLAEGNSADYN